MSRYTLVNDEHNDCISSFELIEKKSKFISYIYKINNEESAINYINKVRNENKDARHVVYIYSFIKNNIVNFRFSDDGEPKGTGTKAIYELLEKEGITNICIIIVRYFGGILLGAGPLSRAYLNTARGAILKCQKKEIYEYIKFQKEIDYQKYQMIKSKIEDMIKDEDIINFYKDFSDVINIKCEVKKDKINVIEKLLL